MPRPPLKRRRSNKQSPHRTGRAPSNAGLSSAPRNKLQQQLANKVIGQRPQDSDDSDKLVTRTRHGRNKKNAEQVFASGGVAKGDKPAVFPTKEERLQRLRSETSEIVRRSRSKSAESSGPNGSKSRTTSVNSAKANASRVLVPASQPLSNASPESVLPQPQPTPMADTSILGTLKPRRRQASILHMIDNVDSSIINPEDEEQFLPDAESTPLNLHKIAADIGTNATSIMKNIPASRKRKLGSDEPVSTTDRRLSAPSSPLSEAITPASDPGSDRLPGQQQLAIYDDEIMAPPQSSSPEPSPEPPKLPPNNSKLKPTVLTTEQLQSHMPSKRRKGTRQRNAQSVFDIPDESDPSGNDQVEDESAFLPHERKTKSRKVGRRETVKAKGNSKPKASTRITKATVGTPKAKSKPISKSTSTPITVVTPRTPLPLTRNLNQENKNMSLARDRNRDQPSKPSGVSKTITPTTTRNQKTHAKQSGGFRPRRGLRSGANTGAESDKENSTARGTTSSRQRTSPGEFAFEDLQPSIEVGDDVDQMDVEVEVGRSAAADYEADHVSNTVSMDLDADADAGKSADVRAWKSKWGDIDTWNLDYEEVSISTGSSSPLRASAV